MRPVDALAGLPRRGTIGAVPASTPRARAPLTLLLAAAIGVSGCATRAVDVAPTPADPAEFAAWSCTRLYDEIDVTQQRAADLAWTVDQRAGQHVVALGLGLSVFWPALLAIRPDGAEAEQLGRLKGRFEALSEAVRRQSCPPSRRELAPDRVAAMPAAPGERLVYEDRAGGAREPLSERVLSIVAYRRNEIEFQLAGKAGGQRWLQDLSGNVIEGPPGTLIWERLLKRDLALGQLVDGELRVVADASQRARVRGQVVAIGPQRIAGRRFDAAVIELFGEATQGESSTRLDGAIVVDRDSGMLLRLDLRSAQPTFLLQRRLVRVDPAS